MFAGGGRTPICNCSHSGLPTKPWWSKRAAALFSSPRHPSPSFNFVVQFVGDGSGNCREPLVDHVEGIRPRCPERTRSNALRRHIISRLPGCDEQAADTQVKKEDAHKLSKIPKSECPDIWIRLPRHKWPKSWSRMVDPVVPLERNLYCHPVAGLLWEMQFEKILLKHGWEKIPNWECLFVHREKGTFLSVYVDDIKIGWKETKS